MTKTSDIKDVVQYIMFLRNNYLQFTNNIKDVLIKKPTCSECSTFKGLTPSVRVGLTFLKRIRLLVAKHRTAAAVHLLSKISGLAARSDIRETSNIMYGRIPNI